MGKRALEFSRGHPDTDAGYQLAAGQLDQLVAQFGASAATQREGLVSARSGAARRHELRRGMTLVPIAHLAEVGKLAAREVHELRQTFTFKPGANTYVAFRTAAGTMAAAAQTHKDVLLKHGLAESVLEEFVQRLDEFDEADKLGNDGRTAHRGATQKLHALGNEIAQIVRVMDGRNRQRFQDDAQLLNSWISASTVLGTPRRVTTPEDSASPPQDGTMPNAGDVRPAA